MARRDRAAARRRGFVVIDETLRSPADDAVFAAGDIATMPAHPRDKAGVYAVRPGRRSPTICAAPSPAELAPGRAATPRAGADRQRRRPRRRLARAVRRAMAQVCGISRTGSTGAGCGATPNCRRWTEEAPRRADALRRLRRQGAGRGAGAGRRAARSGVERCGGDRPRQPRRRRALSFPGAPPLLQTVDFFRAMVSDPYLFGRIAATHALGDIYAMGGAPRDRAGDRHPAAGPSGDRRSRICFTC